MDLVDEYECKYCLRTFSSFKGMMIHHKKKHQESKTPVPPTSEFRCLFCQRKLSCHNALLRHQKTCKEKDDNNVDHLKSMLKQNDIHTKSLEKQLSKLKEESEQKHLHYQNKHLQERLKDKDEFVKYVQKHENKFLNNINNSNNKNITNNFNISMDSIPAITNEWLQYLFSFVMQESHQITSTDDIVRIMEKHGLTDRIHLNDSARMKISWKDGDNDDKLVKDIRGNQLSKKTKDACSQQMIELKNYLLEKMKGLDIMSNEFIKYRDIVGCFDLMRCDEKTIDDIGVSMVKSTARNASYITTNEEEQKLSKLTSIIETFVKDNILLFIISNKNNISCQLADICDGYIQRDQTTHDHFIILNDENKIIQLSTQKVNQYLHSIISMNLPSIEEVIALAFVKQIDKTRYFMTDEECQENVQNNYKYFYSHISDEDKIIDLTIMFDGVIKIKK